jgi:hypothetical protein
MRAEVKTNFCGQRGGDGGKGTAQHHGKGRRRGLFLQNVARIISPPGVAKNYFAKTEAAFCWHDHFPSAARLKRKVS